MKLGYVGLGTMGSALARRLATSRPLTVWDSRPDAAGQLAKDSAVVVAESLPALAHQCDVIMLCLPTSKHVREAVLGSDGLAAGLGTGKIIIDQTAADPVETRAIAAELDKLGVAMVDAPVSGVPRGAMAGTATILCGGTPEIVDKVRPILAEISPNIINCGPIGNGCVAKLVNHAIAACNRATVYEGAAVAVRMGIPLELFSRVINKSSAWSGASERVLPTLSARGKITDFRLELMLKDLRLGTELGQRVGAPMIIPNVVTNLLQMAFHVVGPTATLDDIATLFEQVSGVTFAGA